MLRRVVSVLPALILFFAFSVSIAFASRPDPRGPATAEDRQAAWSLHKKMAESSPFQGLPWRCVGPLQMGGRIVDIEVVPDHPYTFYVAFASGGLWRTVNNGVTFEPLFDHQPTTIMGDVALDPSNPKTIWVGTGENNSSRSSYGGYGLFRSDDGGDTWSSAGLWGSDRIGRILVDPRDGNRVYAAVLGKLYTPQDDRGIYRTDDGGKTWKRVLDGDAWTGFIDMVMAPGDPDTLYAAAWERKRSPWDFTEGGTGSGIYRSTDGGDHWNRLDGGFPRGEQVGRIGLAVTPAAPDTVYAFLDNQELLPESEWDMGDGAVTPKRLRKMTKEEFLRQDPEEIEDFLRSNDLDPTLDAESLIEKIRNDELTLTDLTDALNDANSNLFNTDIRGAEVYRSDDRGDTWTRTHDEPIRQMVHTYGYYFGQIRVSPADPNRLYILGVPLLRSDDGGKSWRNVNEPNVHGDHHEIWIDPAFPERVLDGNDGGLNMSYDGGKSWLKLNPIPVGQFYSIEVDMAEPYNIYGGLQDNGVWKGSSKTDLRAGSHWTMIGGGDGMQVQVDTRDNSTVYQGFQFGNYFRNGKSGRARVKPRNGLKEPALRYNWNTPIALSTHNQDILYYGANKVFRSMDQGETFEAISPDLTRSENRGDVPFATLTSLAESEMKFGLLWAGTDDGQVWVTDDGGVNWNDAGDGLPKDRWVSRVEPSRHEEKRAYLSLNGYREDDPSPYVYVTEDLGRTWTSLAEGLPLEPVNVIREDPVNPDVLYVGTDKGAYVSLDRGKSWESLSGGLPNVPVHDLVIHPRERELVAGTHGRSVWVMDALPVQELDDEIRGEAVHLFPLEEVKASRRWKSRRDRWWHRPEYEPSIRIPYWSREGGKAALSVLDQDGRLLWTGDLEATPGMNQAEWDLVLDKELALAAEKERVASKGKDDDAKGKRNKKARKKKKKAGQKAEAGDEEPTVADTPWAEAVRLRRPVYVTPGTYTIRITAGDRSDETELKVKPPEPRKPRVKKKEPIRGRK